jgi:predicted RNase H-like HicB family nuclease
VAEQLSTAGTTRYVDLPMLGEEVRLVRQYIEAAMRHATYETLAEDSTVYGEIKGFEGVYANAASIETCRAELEEVLEEWVLFRVSRNLELPAVDGVELRVRRVS